MLGIRLDEQAERRLARHAHESGRPKSVIARDWILERLEREEVDDLIRNAAKLHNEHLSEAWHQSAGKRVMPSHDGSMPMTAVMIGDLKGRLTRNETRRRYFGA